MTDVDLLVARGEATRAIDQCDRCPLRGEHRPVPFRGPTPGELMLLTDVPTISEARYHRPLISREGQWIEEQFAAAGLPPLDEWLVNHVVHCPTPEGRAPQPNEIGSCQVHLRSVTRITRPAWVLTLGSVALDAVGVKAQVSKVHGRPFHMPAGIFSGAWILPTYNPGAALRDNKKVNEIAADLNLFGRVLRFEQPPEDIALRVGRGGRVIVA